MKKKIGILGSTGSIGTTTLNIIQNNRKDFNVDFLSTNKNIKKLLNQAVKFKVKNLIIHDKDIFIRYQSILKSKRYNVFNNVNDFTKKNKTRFYYIMSSITGLDGLEPTLDIIKHTKISQ